MSKQIMNGSVDDVAAKVAAAIGEALNEFSGSQLCFPARLSHIKYPRKNSTQLIASTFKVAWEQRNPDTGLIFRSDRGAQYTSHRFRQLLHERSVEQSFSNSGKPHDNAVAESFFATLKKEDLYRKDYTSEAAFKRDRASYIEFYNTQRPHRTLKNQTPCQVEELFISDSQ